MIRSMTGFGKTTANPGGRTVNIEIRTLNSKTLDVNTRIPSQYRDKESEIRAEINKVLERGKVDFMITVDSDVDSNDFTINRSLAQKYYSEIKQLADELGETAGNDVISNILKMPDVLKAGREAPDETEWAQIKAAIADALALTEAFRIAEGELLGKDMIARIQLILDLLLKVEPLEGMRIGNLRERFQRNQDEFLEKTTKVDKFDENRFEQEIFWYLEKLDITEEKLRLRKHCDYFIDTLNSPESNGRKLGFITQEIGREINTLGSKAYNAEIQMIVVQMKDELEKIKEQVSNVL
ncbi:MAG: YicC/YloC family endoribonuclease [Bacteroidales bacterium]|nr:YicC/YloC family endoribonuclease [Bacteroidales bacterium]